MAFQNGNGIVQGKPKGYREKSKEDPYIVNKIVETTALNTFIGKPIADKKDNGAKDEETGGLEYPSQMVVTVFYIHHRDT